MLKEKHQEDREFDFTANDFARVRKLIYQHAGISLSNAGIPIVQHLRIERGQLPAVHR